MSKVIEERITEMRFENRAFEQAVSQSLKTIEKLKQSLNFDNIKDSIGSIDVSADAIKQRFGGALDTVTEKFGMMDIAAGVALGNIVSSAISAGTNIIKSLTIDPIMDGFREYETQLNAVQTILANTQNKGSTIDDVNKALNELNKYADLTIYNFTEMTRNIGTFTAAGVGLDESVNAIKGIANLAAVSGSNSQQASTAMYQLSQALAAGKVQLMDWKSVVNAGMGGELFQNALMRTARVMGTGVDAALAKYGTFTESLTKGGWLTAEVLTETLTQISGAYTEADLVAQGYTKSQAKEIVQLANTSIDAATKVKTFTQLMGTLNEAVGSGWATTWQIIMGDFEEAKALWTPISDVLTGFINKVSDARNSMLQTWKDLGGRTALLEGLKNIVTGVYNLIKPFTDAFRAMIPKVTGEQLAFLCKMFANLTGFFRVSEKTSQNLSKVLVALVSPFKVLSFVVGECCKMLVALVTIISKPIITLFQSIAVTLINMSAGIVDFITKIGTAIKSTNIYLKAFELLTNYIKPMSDKIVSHLTKAYDKIVNSLYAIRNIGKDDIIAFINFIKVQLEPLGFIAEYIQNGVNKLITLVGPLGSKLKTAFLILSDAIINGTGSEGYKIIMSYVESLKQQINTYVNTVKSALAILKEISIITIIKDFINSKFGDEIQTASQYIARAIELLGNAFGKVKTFSLNKFNEFVDRLKSASDKLDNVAIVINKGLTSFASSLVKAKDGIKSSANGFREAINTIVDMIDPNKFLQFITGGALIGILWKLKSVFDNFMDLIKGKELTNSFIGMMNGLGDTLEVYQKNLKADRLMKIAGAIAILAGALFIISRIDVNKMLPSIGALGAVMLELTLMMAAFDKLGSDKSMLSSTKMVVTMIGMSTALLILSGVFVKMANLKWDAVAKGCVSIAVMCTTLVLAANSISKNATRIVSSSVGLMIFASALMSITKVVDKLGSLKPQELTKGLISIGVLLAELALFMKVADLDGMGVVKGLGLVLLASSLLIFASAVEKFGQIKPAEIIKGILSIAATLAVLRNIPGLTSTSIGLAILGLALMSLTKAIEKIDTLKPTQIAKGLLTIGVAIASITAAMKLMPDSSIAKSIAITLIVLQLTMLAKAIEKFGTMNIGVLAQGILSIAASLTVIVLAMSMMNGSIGGALALTIVSMSLGLLAKSLQTFGSIPVGTIVTGLLAMAGVFTVLGVSGLLLAPIVPVLLGLSGAVVLLGVGCLALGAGLLIASTGLVALAGASVAGFAALSNGLKSLLALIPSLGIKIAEGFLAFAKVISDNMPVIIELIVSLAKGVITGLIALIPMVVAGIYTLLTTLITTINDHAPEFVQAGCDLLISLLNGIADNIEEIVDAGMRVAIGFINGVANRVDELIQAGMNLVSKFVIGIVKGFANSTVELSKAVVEAIDTLVDSAIDALLGYVTSFIDAGVDLVDGLIKGIYNGLSGVVGAIVDVAKSAIGAGKDELDINSPSKEFETMGRFCDEGLANGLYKYSRLITDATSEVSGDAISMLRETLSNIDLDDPDFNGPVIRPVIDLSNVSDGINTIDNMLENQNGTISLSAKAALANVRAIGGVGAKNISDNSELISAIKDLKGTLSNVSGDSYNINGITYDDGSNINSAVQTLVRAAKIGRRI